MRPNSVYLKLDVDGCSKDNSGSGGGGVVVRDQDGNFIMTFASYYRNEDENDGGVQIYVDHQYDQQEHKTNTEDCTSMSLNISAEPSRNQRSDPIKVSKPGMKKSGMGEASAEISSVQDELHGNRNNDKLGKTSQPGTVANKVKILGSKETGRGSTEFNHRDILKVAEFQRTPQQVACMVLGSTDKFEGTMGLEQKEGVEMKMKMFDKLTDIDSTIHVTQSRLKETSPVKDHESNKECPAPVSKELYEMNLVGRPILESIGNELGTDVANTTGEQELIPNCDFEMPMSEKLGDASTRGPVPSYQLGDLQGTAENSFKGKRSRANKSTSHQELDMKSIVEASQNAYAPEQDIVCNDDSSDATTKFGSIMSIKDVDHTKEIGKEGKSSITQGAETSLPSDNNEATGATKEQVLSVEGALDYKGNIESGNASSMKRKKTNHRKSTEKIPDKLDGEDDSWVKLPHFSCRDWTYN
ncbi:hypothetical protein HAX54_002465 [Datura stramonium]|uniref:Uncharacterized protein n=1 Tax=Datura stramonium TaxID=4076 RepID=A0ABS8RT06_DATST|nr:hypothetical protein [Datura stramonium]